jgi:hypothetical protein
LNIDTTGIADTSSHITIRGLGFKHGLVSGLDQPYNHTGPRVQARTRLRLGRRRPLCPDH